MPLAIALWLGLACGAGLPAGAAWACLAAVLPLAWLADRAPTRTGTAILALATALAGAGRGAGSGHRVERARAGLPPDGALVRIVARLDEPARREGGEPVACARVLAASPALPAGVRVRLRLPGGCTADWGDTVRALVRLERFGPVRNPGGYDARTAADAAGTIAHGRAAIAAIAPTRRLRDGPVRLACRARRGIEAAFTRGMSGEARELVAPLVFGDRSAMSPDLDAALRGSGLVHLLALSGLHVVWLAGVLRALAALVRGGRRTRAFAGAACAAAYALLAGPLPSLVRAVAGECAATLARLTQRALDPQQSLALGVLVLLAARPGWANDLGFQLSCAATAGLVTLSPPLQSVLPRARLARVLGGPLAVTAAAQLAALPLLLARFHALPWTGFASNLVAVPVSEWMLAAAWIGGVLDALLPGAGAPWLHACEPLAAALREIAGLTARWPGALLGAGADPASPALAAAGAVLLALAAAAPRASERRPAGVPPGRAFAGAAGALLVACAVLAAATARPLAPPPGTWWLVAIDVGQGDALALAFADGWWLVDAGPRTSRGDAGETAVVPFLRWAGVRRLDRLLLTHDDSDHTGGARAVRRDVDVRETGAPAPRPGVPGPAARFGARAIGRGDTLRRAPPVAVLWPPRPGEAGEALARRGDNAAALVLEAGESRGRALLMADADSLVEAALVVAPGVAVLKAGHHGSGSSSGAAFVRRIAPARALLSVGKRNAYGHPHPAALAHLAAAGAALDRTDHDGAIWYECSPAGVRRIDWRRDPPRPVPANPPQFPPGPRP